MYLLYMNEHVNCFNYDKRSKPQVEVVKFAKWKKGNLLLGESEIVFFMEGRIKLVFNNSPEQEVTKGQFLFLPSGGKYSFQVMANTMIIVFRINKQIRLCDTFDIEQLYYLNEEEGVHKQQTNNKLNFLEINPRLWHYLDGINDYFNDGVRCRSLYNIKLQELFFILRLYYSKEELYYFFSLILSEDTAFSEYIRSHWHQFHTVQALAESLHMTHKQFCSKFVSVFGKRPLQWIAEEKAHNIHKEIISTKKQFKQIAAENGFSHETIFTRFCKRNLGATPSELRNK
ncbi:helix-turn-helix transcriptional regulator [Bacteroidales bacterium OttesenSCG-928-I14]|nr:helix-turn-helix transcriptional regulator [Bacteroidales bacterium OttesenSCG-928-I14]